MKQYETLKSLIVVERLYMLHLYFIQCFFFIIIKFGAKISQKSSNCLKKEIGVYVPI